VKLETLKTDFRFSGHDTFQCRYAWLPKAVMELNNNGQLFVDEDKAMVRLGVGKNMVRSIKFWVEAAGFSEQKADNQGLRVTKLGNEILYREGYDPFLEKIQTLWLIHWNIATNNPPLFAWDFLLNRWHRLEFSKSEVLEAFRTEVERQDRKLSSSTLETHFDVFLHSYLPTRSRKGEVLEDNLDCPLVELRLLNNGQDRPSADSSRREPTFSFRIEEKTEISDELFIYCLNEFWESKPTVEKTLSFREVCIGAKSPGQIFKLPEKSVRDRLDRVARESKGVFTFEDSTSQQQVRKVKAVDSFDLLQRIYD
jgi:hypothetical protein